MQSFISFSRRHAWSVLALILAVGPNARAAGNSIDAFGSSRNLAFARYIASQDQRDPFVTAESAGIVVEAALPELYKSAALLAVRKKGGDQRSQLQVLQFSGDGTVAEEVIDRYFTTREQKDGLPLSSLAITPANYKFHFAGEVRTGGGLAYVYDITPKKKGPGRVTGQLWMDSATGQEITLRGHFVDKPLMGGRIDIVRETCAINGALSARVTHLAFSLPRLGRAELSTTEVVVTVESLGRLGDFMSSQE